MFRMTLAIAALVGGLTYAFTRVRRDIAKDRQLDMDARSRWDDEGGAVILPKSRFEEGAASAYSTGSRGRAH